MYSVHISDIRTFLKCRRAWNFSSPLRLNLEPTLPYAPFYIGRAIHHCIELWKAQGAPMRQSLSDYIQNERNQMDEVDFIDIEKNVELILGILEHYALVWEEEIGPFSDTNLEFIEMEKEFSVPLPEAGKDVFLEGRFDGIVQRKDDKTFWIWETKTTRSISEFSRSLFNDNQCTVYTWAARRLGDYPVKGVLYNLIKKSTPTQPHLVSGGLLQKTKTLNASYWSYLRAIKDEHPAFTEEYINRFYGEYLEYLSKSKNDWFMRQPVVKSQDEIDIVMSEIVDIAREMINPNTPLYANPSWLSCTYCQFRNPCTAVNRGKKIADILGVEYRRKVVAQSMRTTEEIADA